jgi:hypothetical protein
MTFAEFVGPDRVDVLMSGDRLGISLQGGKNRRLVAARDEGKRILGPQRAGSYIGLFQLSEYEFGKFGFGQIRSPRDNAVAAAYKVITEGILFEWITHGKPNLSDLYLIHQQGWEDAAEHISQPGRVAWKSMCATSEGREKGEKWCKRAIWGNTLPAFRQAWKSVVKVTSEAFVGMWRARVAEFYTKYVATAAGGANQ